MLLRKNYFKMIFCSCIVFIEIFVLAFSCFILYRRSNEKSIELQKECQIKAENMARIIDGKFETVDILSNQIASSYWIDYVAAQADVLFNMVDRDMKESIYSQLANCNALLQIGEYCCVIFPNKELVVDKADFWNMERYLRVRRLDNEWKETIDESLTYSTLKLFDDSKGNIDGEFLVIKKIKNNTYQKAFFLMKIDATQFKKFLKTNMIEAMGIAILQEEEIIYTMPQTEIAGNSVMKFQIPSQLYNWEYEITVELDNMGNPTLVIEVFMFLMGGLILTLLSAYLLARVIYQPIIVLIKKLDKRNDNISYGLDRIEELFDELHLEKETMENLANQYYQIGLNEFLYSLLTGEYIKENVSENARWFHTDFMQEMEYMVICMVSLDEQKYQDFYDALLKIQIDCLSKEITTLLYNDKEFKNSVLILGTLRGQDVLLDQRERIQKIGDEYFAEIDVDILVGNTYRGFEGIKLSYRDAMKKMEKNINGDEDLFYYYPFEVETNFTRQMRHGNYEKAKQILFTLEQENKERQVLPIAEKRLLFVLYESVLRFGMKIGVDVQLAQEGVLGYSEEFDIAEMWKNLHILLKKIESSYQEGSDVQVLGNKMVKYVNEHYTFSGLSLVIIAEQFGVSRSTVSKIFKETAKMTFVEYLHKLRVDYAKQLILEGNRNVLQVGRESGFETEITFNRAFTKNEGITVREFIKKCIRLDNLEK